MYIKGVKDYNRDGEARETGLYAGPVSNPGELRQTKNGKEFGSASVRAFNREDGTAAFMTLKSFEEQTARRIAALQKNDRILVCGSVERREYNGKTYTDMLVDFLLTDAGGNQAALLGRMADAGFSSPGTDDFAEIGEEDGELPF